MEVLPPVSYTSSNMNWFGEQGRASRWSPAENKMFENALAVHDRDTPDRWHKVAAKIPGKTVEDVVLHYRDLELDVRKIEAGLIPAPGYSTSSPPFTLEVSTGYMFDGFKPSYNFRIGGKRTASTRPLEHERKKGVPWTEEEHKLFLMGLKKYGKGDWRNISRNFVITKTPTQVASHAQKYFIRQLSGGKEKRRASIHDITTVNLDETRSPSPDNGQHPSPDHSSYVMQLHRQIPARPTSFLWNQSGNGGTVKFAASRSNVILPLLPLGADSNQIKEEPHHPRYDDGTFTGIRNKVFQMQSGDCYYRRG